MSKPRLPSAPPQGLGQSTIMDRALAAKHGVVYVHLAAFAIDVDRVREHVEGPDDTRPFAWEVFLTEIYLLSHFRPSYQPEQVLLMEDIVLGVLEGAPDVLGGQIVFAIWDAIVRGEFPSRLRGAFRAWQGRPDELVGDLAQLFAQEPTLSQDLARGCLETPLDPPLAPPTVDALRALSGLTA